jgi:hypothetical protein
MRFLIEIAAVLTVSVIDPIVIIPVIVAACWRKWWLPPVVGALAGLVSYAVGQHLSTEYGGGPDLAGPKFVAGALLGAIAAALAPVIRRLRGNPLG